MPNITESYSSASIPLIEVSRTPILDLSGRHKIVRSGFSGPSICVCDTLRGITWPAPVCKMRTVHIH